MFCHLNTKKNKQLFLELGNIYAEIEKNHLQNICLQEFMQLSKYMWYYVYSMCIGNVCKYVVIYIYLYFHCVHLYAYFGNIFIPAGI